MKSKQPHFTNKGLVALVLLALVYGAGPTITRYLSGGIGTFEQWYLRYFIAFLLGAVLFYRQISWRKFLRLPLQEWLVLLFRIVVGEVIAIGFYTLAAQRTKLALIAFLQVLPMTSILGILLFRETLSWRRAAAMMIALAGTAVVVVNNPRDLLSLNFGAVLTLISLVLYALMLVTRRWHSDALNNQEMSVAMAGGGFVLTYALSLVLYHRWMVPAGHWNDGFILVLLLGGCQGIAANFFGNYGFEHVSTIIAGNILTLEELFGPLFGFIFYNELLTMRNVVGGVIILLSVLLMNQVARREHRATQAVIAPD